MHPSRRLCSVVRIGEEDHVAGTTQTGQGSLTIARQARSRNSMLERGVHVLQAFRPTGNPMSMSEIARRTGLPKTTAHRLI